MKTNFEKYLTLHTEVLNRLEDGEITIETAKEVIDLAFEKYVTEGWYDKDGWKFLTARSLRKTIKEVLGEAKFKKVSDDTMKKLYELKAEFDKIDTEYTDKTKKILEIAKQYDMQAFSQNRDPKRKYDPDKLKKYELEADSIANDRNKKLSKIIDQMRKIIKEDVKATKATKKAADKANKEAVREVNRKNNERYRSGDIEVGKVVHAT